VLTGQPVSDTANINTRNITVSATGIDKTYDGTLAESVTLSSNKVAGDTVNLSDTSELFTNKNVGNGKTVNVTGISISGADASNYTLTSASASTTANITAAELTVQPDSFTRLQAHANPTLTGSITGFVTGENITFLGAVPTFSTTADMSSIPGNYAITASGGVAGNYTFHYLTGTMTVDAYTGPSFVIPNSTFDRDYKTADVLAEGGCSTAMSSHVANLGASCGTVAGLVPTVQRLRHVNLNLPGQ